MALTCLLLFSGTAQASDFPVIPLDTTDNQSPALISATLSKPSAPAKSADSIIITIVDDKNSMRAGGTFEFKAPPGTGTLFLNEGYSQGIGAATLLNQTQTNQGITQTWEIPFKVPSVEGVWVGYRVDFADAANNSVQFLNNTPGSCSNASRYKYPNQSAGSLDGIPCTFNLNLTVLPEVPSEDAVITTPELTSALQDLVSAQNNLKTLIAKLNTQPGGDKANLNSPSIISLLNYQPNTQFQPGPPIAIGAEVSAAIPDIKILTSEIQAVIKNLQAASFKGKSIAPSKNQTPTQSQTKWTCVKGKSVLRFTGKSAACPNGYKIANP